MTAVWNKIEELSEHIKTQFENTGWSLEDSVDDYDWQNSLYQSLRYRRAHLQVIDRRETHKVYILHATVFPHYNDPSPIWGFDAVCGANKITGAFHDFSNAGDTDHYMMKWFAEEGKKYGWTKPRDLPDWAKHIFSKNMVAAGNVQEGQELEDLCKLTKDSLNYYLKNVGNSQQDVADYHMAQNRYCYYQKQNPHVVRSMVNMGVEEHTIRQFVNTIQYPETA